MARDSALSNEKHTTTVDGSRRWRKAHAFWVRSSRGRGAQARGLVPELLPLNLQPTHKIRCPVRLRPLPSRSNASLSGRLNNDGRVNMSPCCVRRLVV
jgi:hypothetical protein